MAKKKATFESNLKILKRDAIFDITQANMGNDISAARLILSPFIKALKQQQKEIVELKDKIDELETDQKQKSEYISELEGKTTQSGTVKQLKEILSAIGFPEDNYNAPDQADYVEIGKAGVGVYVMGDCPLYLQNDIEQFLETIKSKY